MRNTDSARSNKAERMNNAKSLRNARTDVTQEKCRKKNKLEYEKIYEPDIAVGQTVCYFDEKTGVYIKGEIAYINQKRRWFMVETLFVNSKTGNKNSIRTSFNFCELYCMSYRGVRVLLWTAEDLQWLDMCKQNAFRKGIDLETEIRIASARRAAGIECEEVAEKSDDGNEPEEDFLLDKDFIPESDGDAEEISISDEELNIDELGYESIGYTDEYGSGDLDLGGLGIEIRDYGDENSAA